MDTAEKTVETKVSQEEVNLDEIFNTAPTAEAITLPDSKPNLFTRDPKVDMDFMKEATDVAEKVEETTETKETTETTEATEAEEVKTPDAKDSEDAFAAIDAVDNPDSEDKTETRGRKKIDGITDVFNKLIKEDKIIAFDDDKTLDEYTAKDWEDLINANLEESANEARRETPQKFFDSLPQELQIAARYVADGGQDLKGLFSALSTVEEVRELDVKKEADQEYIIREYLGATGYGTAEEIAEEIEIWKDLGKLETQANKFKPKLDKMQEKVVAKKLEEQEIKSQQQQQASQQYMQNVYETLKDGSVGSIKIDKKVQSMLYNGLVQPSYSSISGKNTNLLGHLLEKYQFVEPNYPIITEALWLLADPDGYKAKIMEKGAQKSIEKTVRKLKTEQSNKAGSSLGVGGNEDTSKPTKKKLARGTNNIFKRF